MTSERDALLRVGQAFAVEVADTPAMLEAAFRLRHQVYCRERGYEQGQGRREADHYDPHARHAVLTQHSTGRVVGTVRVARTTWQTGRGGRSISGEDIAILRADEIRQLPEGQALVIAENSKPIIAKLTRCIEGRSGRALLDRQRSLRADLAARQRVQVTPEARTIVAVAEARRRDLIGHRR